MNRKLLHRIGIAWLVFLAICIAVYITFKLTIGKTVLAGESRHDFGMVLIDDPASTFEHTFKLTNNTSKTLNIENVRPSCGCTTASPSTRTLEPDGELVLSASLELKASGYRESRITIMFEDESFHNLWIKAHGKMRQSLTASTDVLPVRQEKQSVMVVYAEVWDDVANAPEPEIVTDEGLEAHFTRWNLQHKGDNSKGKPARWSGRIVVTQTAEEIARNSKLTLKFKDNEPVVVGVYTDHEGVILLDKEVKEDSE